MGLTNAERQARWRAKRDTEIERLRKATPGAAPASDELIAARQEIAALRSLLATTATPRAARIDPATLPMSTRQKLESAIRQHKRKLDLEFDQRVRDECRKALEDTILPSYNRTYAQYQDLIKARKGILDKAAYRKILSCLHTDSRKSVTDEKLNEAFHLFSQLELRLVDEKQNPTPTMQMPRTYEETMALKRKVSEERKAKRGQQNVVRR